ncbi:MAG: hypothetical protein K0B11_02590 [Mariniphaga sp.]|nr:hypothetical protein [Mariniphaga sp.]
MNRQIAKKRFREGEVVCALVNPKLKLVIRRYVDRIYYCKIQQDTARKELVYFDRELMDCKNLKEIKNTAKR